MATIRIRELLDRLSHYIRQVERTVTPITEHSQPIAAPPKSRLEQLVDAGLARPPLVREPIEIRWPDIHLPPGTVRQLIDEDRGER